VLASVLLVASVLLAEERSPPAAHWWEQEPLRIFHLVSSMGQIAFRPPAELAAAKAAQLYNAEHLEVMGMPKGLDDQEFFFSSKLAGKKNEDYLGKYLPEAKKRGLRVLIYFNVHWYNLPFAEKHPDWLQITEAGQPLRGVYQTGTDFCVNSPWREWVFQVLRDLCAYPIDGIFYDGPIFFPETCYCRYCRARFQKVHGRDLPSKKLRQGKPFRDLVEFQADSLREFLADSRRVIKGINPEIAFYINGGVRGANWATGRLNRALVSEQDLLGSEGGFIYGDLTRTPLWKPGVTAKLLEAQAPGKPRVIFSAAAHKPWTFSLLPAPELRLLYADTIANAASVWMGITPFEMEQPEIKALTEMNRLVARHGAYYIGTRSEATTALVWSDTSANFYSGPEKQGEAGSLEAEFSGLADALLRAQTPFDVIDDVSLESEDLTRYGVVFLPNVAAMSDRAAGRLRDYVQRGGHVFATFETSRYDETGVRRADFALADLFGASAAGPLVGPMRWDFMKPRAASPLLAGIPRELIPSPVYHLRTTPKDGEVVLSFTKPLTGPYDGLPELSDDPALVVRLFGKGEAVYFSGDLGSAIQTFHLPELLRLVENAVRRLAPPPVTVGNAPQSLEIVLRSQQQGKRLLLHLVNFTGEMTRPIQRVLPAENLRVTLLKAGSVKRASTLVRPQVLKVERDRGGGVQFALPRVDEYEVVVIER